MAKSPTEIVRRLLDVFCEKTITPSELQFGCLRWFTDESVATFFEIASADARETIMAAVNSAPCTDLEWATFMVVQPECDPVQMTADYRRGVEIVRRYLESTHA